MTKQDYILIAQVIAQFRSNQAVREMALVLANAFKRENDRFDYDRFFKACGIDPTITKVT